MKTLRSLTCIAVISVLCACGQKPDESAAQQQQASPAQASATETSQNQPKPVAPSAPAPAPTPAPAPAPATAQNSAAAQGSSLTGQSSSLSGTETGFNIQINLSSDVLFDFDKAELKPEADSELQKAADIIRQKGKGLILISGYTDSKGSDAYNKRLSLARAQAVKNWFEAQGLHQNYQTEGLGAANPVAPNANDDGSDNPEGRAKNRRVEIIVNKTKQLGE